MNVSADLYNLIHSLSRNEKRYISLSILQNSKNEYFRLFKMLEKQKHFNEKALHTLMQKEKSSKKLPVLKAYLKEYILKKLNSFYYKSSVEITLQQSLMETDILLKKQFFVQGKKKLIKIKRLADKNEEFEILLQCIKREKKILRSIYRPSNENSWNRLLKEEISLTKKIDNFNRYDWLSGKLSNYYNTVGQDIRTKYQKEKIRRILRHPLLKNTKGLLSKAAKLRYHHLRSLCYYFLLEYQNALESNKAFLTLIEPRVFSNEQTVIPYLGALNNRINILLRLKDYSNAAVNIELIRNSIKMTSSGGVISEQMLRRNFIISYAHQLNLLLGSGQYKKALELIPLVEQIIRKYSNGIENEILMPFYYIFSYLHFVWGNYRQTLLNLHKIINKQMDETQVREDVYSYSKLLYVLTYIELYGEEVPENLIKSTYEFLVKRKHLLKAEYVFLRFIRNKFLRPQEPGEVIQELRKLKRQMIQLQDNSYEKSSLKYFDFLAWIESKIHKTSFLEQLKKQ